MMTMVDLQTLAKALRAMSQKSQTTNGAAMLQAVAAWLEGRDIFSPPAELWEHADRLCGMSQGAKCEKCGGLLNLDYDQLCVCRMPRFTTASLDDVFTTTFAVAPEWVEGTIATLPQVEPRANP